MPVRDDDDDDDDDSDTDDVAEAARAEVPPTPTTARAARSAPKVLYFLESMARNTNTRRSRECASGVPGPEGVSLFAPETRTPLPNEISTHTLNQLVNINGRQRERANGCPRLRTAAAIGGAHTRSF